jgi:serine phosphatase RsbU (regulator of sigma subunit)/tetratricopeptide (TPR) repeat protein
MSASAAQPLTTKEIDRLNDEAWAAHAESGREAFGLAEHAYHAALSSGHADGIRMALRTMAVTALEMGLHAEAFEHATEAARLFKESGDHSREALMQNVLGGVHYYLGDHESRLKCNMRGLELCRISGDHPGLLRALNNTADTYTRLGDFAKAMAMFKDCLALADDSTPFIQCIVLSNMGEVNLLEGRTDLAKELVLRSQEVGKRIGYTEIMVSNLIMLSQIALGVRDAHGAIRLLKEAQTLVNERIALNDQASIHRYLSEAHEKLGRHDRALSHHRTFHDLSQQHLGAQKVKEVRSIEFKQEIRTLQHATATLEKLVEERTRQLEQTLAHLQQRDHERQQDLEVEQAVNQFSQSLFLQKTVDDVLWDLAKSCIARLGFVDAVIYLLHEDGTKLIQKAAYGPKNPIDLDILNPITIELGKGIVGSVALAGHHELIHDTSADDRYIVDDAMRLSEIAVPIVSNGKVIGVIDSEHPERNFFTEKHLRVLKTIASLVANRIERIREQEERERLQVELIAQLQENEKLQSKVTRELEDKVKERTLEIEQARERIELQAKDIRDSIHYARSIQNALMPQIHEVERLFPDNFILYLPRDVVSGDFYWVASKGERSYLAVADCTGHGVPGALVSVLCVEKLEQALLLADAPGEILRIVNSEVKKALRQSAEGTSRDGMDVALIAFDPKTGILSYSGAKRPLWHVRSGVLTIYSPTRFSIGGHSPDSLTFIEDRVNILPGDMVYLCSDGYSDQFGGEGGRKFSTGRLRKVLCELAHLSMPKQHGQLLSLLHDWQDRQEQVDDILLAGIRF